MVKLDSKLNLNEEIELRNTALTRISRAAFVINIDNLGLGKTLQIGDLHFEGPRTDECKERCCLPFSSPVPLVVHVG